MAGSFPITLRAAAPDAGKRLDHFLVLQLPDLSRARIQQLITENHILVNESATKPSLRLRGDEQITILGPPQLRPLHAMAEDIPLDIVYEDDDLAVINKPAGMMVHAGAGKTDEDRNRGTLVNALLHRFASLSAVGGEVRPGIVHRLDKDTSGLIVVAKNDQAHRRLGEQFSGREIKKTYFALVHGWPRQDSGTIHSAISRDRVHRTRMTTRGSRGRDAISHYVVQRRIESLYGKFSLLEVKIDTGRTHQIRVHLSSLGHPIVGDSLYGAPKQIKPPAPANKSRAAISLPRNFLHAARLALKHPSTGAALEFSRPLPADLQNFLSLLETE